MKGFRKFVSKVRFLPVTIFFATMMLTVKVNNIWDGFGNLKSPPIEVAGVVAQTEEQAEEEEEEGADPAATPEDGVSPEDSAAAEDVEIDEESYEDEEEELTSKLITDDPTLLTPAEIDLLQKLAERRDELDRRERELEIRVGLLAAAESRIDAKIAELQELRGIISGLIKTFDDQQDAKRQSIVKIYESMKPKEAAKIFENLELDTLLDVAERMKERKLAPIMAKMDPERAREMTVELRRLRELPPIGANVGG